MSDARPVVVATDIAAARARRAVRRIVSEWRLDGQKSVHHCRLTPNAAEDLFVQIAERLDTRTDRLLLVWVDTRRPLALRGRAQAGDDGRLNWLR
ncbi:MAG: CRISPR-associated endonuclease Cas2 [Chromatiales bacterium]|nr:CRISPR-associated endonuclease Cas2 [Chromatiales bacterium]